MRALVLALICLSFTPNLHANIFEKLRIYRTYYFVTDVAQNAQRFEVWIKRGETWSNQYIYIENQFTIDALKTDDFHPTGKLLDDFRGPPDDLAVPADLRSLSRRLRKKVQALYASGLPVQIGFAGSGDFFKVTEIIPLGRNARGNFRGFYTTANFKLEKGLPEKVAEFGPSFGSFPNALLADEAVLLNYTLPSVIEGSAILRSGADSKEVAAREAYQNLLGALANYSRADQKTFRTQNEIMRPPRADNLIPSGFRQNFTLEFIIRGGAQVHDRVALTFALKEALANKLNVKTRAENSGLNFHLSGGFGVSLRLDVSDDHGIKASVQFTPNQDIQVVRNSNGDPAILTALNFTTLEGGPLASPTLQLVGSPHAKTINVNMQKQNVVADLITGPCERALIQ